MKDGIGRKEIFKIFQKSGKENKKKWIQDTKHVKVKERQSVLSTVQGLLKIFRRFSKYKESFYLSLSGYLSIFKWNLFINQYVNNSEL